MEPKDIFKTEKRCKAFLFIVKNKIFYPNMLKPLFSTQGIYDFLALLNKHELIEECNLKREMQTAALEKIKVRLSRINPVLRTRMIRNIHWYKPNIGSKFYSQCVNWCRNWFEISQNDLAKMNGKDIIKLGE